MRLPRTAVIVPIVIGFLCLEATTSPAWSETWSGGGKSCGPDQQVRISATTTGGSTIYIWVTGQGQLQQTSKSGKNTSVYTGTRVITSWQAIADNVVSAGVSCS